MKQITIKRGHCFSDCERCGKSFTDGEVAWRTTTGKYYCESCFQEIYIEVEE